MQRLNLFGVEIDAVTMGEALGRLEAAITGGEHVLVGVVNAAKIVNMRGDPLLRQGVTSAQIVLADGMSVVWASRLLGRPLPERVAGIDLMHGLLERGSQRGWRFYALGATEEVNAAAVRQMERLYPGAQVVGRHHGYFNREDEPEIVASIQAARPDVLFVAMSSPRKETFLARRFHELGAGVCHGVGGSFDVLAGKVTRAPPVLQDAGLEWLWRVVHEPRRMWRRYLRTNAMFVGMTLSEIRQKARRDRGLSGL